MVFVMILRLLNLGLLLQQSFAQQEEKKCCLVEKRKPWNYVFYCPQDLESLRKMKNASGIDYRILKCPVSQISTQDKNGFYTENIDVFYDMIKTNDNDMFFNTNSTVNRILGRKALSGVNKYAQFVCKGYKINGFDKDVFEGSKIVNFTSENYDDKDSERFYDENMFRQSSPTIQRIKLIINSKKIRLSDNIFRPASELNYLDVVSLGTKFNCKHFKGLEKLNTLLFSDHGGQQDISDCFFCGLKPITKKICYIPAYYENKPDKIHLSLINSSKSDYDADGYKCHNLDPKKAKSWNESSFCKLPQCIMECKTEETTKSSVSEKSSPESEKTPNNEAATTKKSKKNASNTCASGLLLFVMMIFAQVLRH